MLHRGPRPSKGDDYAHSVDCGICRYACNASGRLGPLAALRGKRGSAGRSALFNGEIPVTVVPRRGSQRGGGGHVGAGRKELAPRPATLVILPDRHAVSRLPHLPRQQCHHWRSRPGRLGCYCRHRRLGGRKSRPKIPPAPQQNADASRCLGKQFGYDPQAGDRPAPGASQERSQRQQNDHDPCPICETDADVLPIPDFDSEAF
jgi:hypothetical protein